MVTPLSANDAIVVRIKQLMSATTPETTQEMLAKASGLTPYLVQRYLTDRPAARGDRYGRLALKVDDVWAIAEAFGMTGDELAAEAEQLRHTGVPKLRTATKARELSLSGDYPAELEDLVNRAHTSSDAKDARTREQ